MGNRSHSIHTKLILAAVVGFVVLAALGVPVLAYLPLLAIFAVCTLAMSFMMRGMNHRQGTDRDVVGDRSDSGHRH